MYNICYAVGGGRWKQKLYSRFSNIIVIIVIIFIITVIIINFIITVIIISVSSCANNFFKISNTDIFTQLVKIMTSDASKKKQKEFVYLYC